MQYLFRFFLVLSAVVIIQYNRLEAQDARPLSIGETLEINSDILGEKRTLNIYLPPGYDNSQDVSYPVIYLLDGSLNEDFLHIVGLVQFFEMQMGFPKTIVVGIGNVDRKRDFTFHTDIASLTKTYPTTGKSALFIDFIEKELKPFIRNKYKTGKQEILLGQSLGGLVATEIFFKKPGLFNNYIIVSPSLWWDNESLLKAGKTYLDTHLDSEIKVTVIVGKERKQMEDDAQALAVLLQNSKQKKLKVDFITMPKEDHATILQNAIYEVFLRMNKELKKNK
ncbi:MAG: alpha/beta hydrolase [Saprospiraceae bacterium]|nr:alpha/beta hydrolase [Candidatus Brachybacter algidus]